MLKSVSKEIWAFDVEWVPDPETGRRVYSLSSEMPDEQVINYMFEQAGATQENPRPFIKTALSRVVSISALIRTEPMDGGDPDHKLISRPKCGAGAMAETDILQGFLDGLGETKPQIVGFNLVGADLPILVQRAAANSVRAKGFCSRPQKPWEGMDYFYRFGDAIVDLMDVYSNNNRNNPSLHEMACAMGIPGKIDMAGDQVLDNWLEDKVPQIVAYNEFDALTTFLVWLRTVRMAGLRDPEACDREEELLRSRIEEWIGQGRKYLQQFLTKWDDLGVTV